MRTAFTANFSNSDNSGSGFCLGLNGPKALHLALLANGWALATPVSSAPLDYDAAAIYGAVFSSNANDYRWNTYFKDDALHAQLPIFMTLGYRQRYSPASSYYGMGLYVQVGSELDASGAIVSP